LVEDILEAVGDVLGATPPRREALNSGKFQRSYLLRHLQTIGEAASRLSQALKDCYPDVPWRQIADMRHVLVRNCFQVDWDAVHDTSIRDVPPLRRQIEVILAAFPPDGEGAV
jgi:uncharacterized protein with HEPN domain